MPVVNVVTPVDFGLTIKGGHLALNKFDVNIDGTTILQTSGVLSAANSHVPVSLAPTANGLTLSGQQLGLGLVTTLANGAMSATDKIKLDSLSNYAHPTQSAINYTNSGPNIVSSVTINTLGHVTAISSRTLTLADLGYSAYVHPTGDGNLHVLATGTTNSGKALIAGATAGSLSWGTPWTGMGYLTSFTESDPIFTASASFGITATNISNWNTAFGWGNHSGLYSLINHNHTLQSLSDVESAISIPPVNYDVLRWNSAIGKWMPWTITTSFVAEGVKLFYTDARARSAISLTTTGNSGASTYNAVSGLLNIPNYTLSGLGGQVALVSGTNIKTVGGQTILGSGDITLASLNYWTLTGSDVYRAAGNVGVGATPSLGKLHVFGGNIAIENSSNQGLWLYNSSDANRAGYFTITGDGDFSNRFVNIGSNSSGYGFKFTNASGTWVTVLSGGNVGIGTTLPDYRLTVNGALNVGNGATNLGVLIRNVIPSLPSSSIQSQIGSLESGLGFAAGSLYLQPRTGVSASLVLGTEGTAKAVLNSSGNVGIGTILPQQRLHSNISTAGVGVGLMLSNDATNATIGRGTGILFAGTGNANLAQIEAQTMTASNNSGGLIFRYSNAGTLTEGIRLANNGFVGINTVPTNPLHIVTSNNDPVRIGQTSATGYSQILFQTNTRTFQIGVGAGSETAVSVANEFFVYDGTAGAVRLAIDSAGRMLLGNVLNGTKLLQINGGIRQTDVISGLVWANAQGEFQSATAANIAATLGAGNYIQNQNAIAQSANMWINGVIATDSQFILRPSSTSGFLIGGAADSDTRFYIAPRLSNNSGWDWSSEFGFTNSGTRGWYFDSNLGIGTTNPQYLLDVIGVGRFFENIYVQSTTTSSSARIGLYQTGSNWWFIENVFPGNLKFTRGITDYAMFANDGKFLVGTTSVYNSSLVQVNGSITQRGVLSKLIYADSTGQLIEATASHIAATLGAGNYIQNQTSTTQVAGFVINSYGKAASFFADLGTGYSTLQPGNSTQSGYFEIYKSTRVRLGYIGFDNTNITYVSENGANHVFLGNSVGIGITTTSGKLHVRDSSNARFWLDNSSANTPYAYFQVNTTSTSYLDIQAGDALAYRNIVLNSLGGNVLIGTTSPTGTWKLQVNSGSTTGNGLYVSGKIFATDDIQSYSDRRLKENLEPINIGEKLNGFNIFKYNKIGTHTKQIGVIAQDLQRVFPELISKEGQYLGVSYNGVAAISLGLGIENKSEIEKLKKRISALEKEISRLRSL